MSELRSEGAARPVPGIDAERFGKWATQNLSGAPILEQASLLSGGHSNLNILLKFDQGNLVLRRPPLGHVMESAHDMGREYRALTALSGTEVPVARPVYLASEVQPESGVDAPFFIMDFIAGEPLGSRADNDGKEPEQLAAASHELTRTLAKLHAIAPDSVGLTDFGRPEGYLERQLRRWAKQLELSRSRETAKLDSLIAAMPAPPQHSPVAIVHGDFKMNNALIDFSQQPARIAAILDWEMATLGDPYTDLAMCGMYWSMPEAHPAIARGFESPVDYDAGYPRFKALLETYERETGEPLPDMTWYWAFAAMKISVITESLHYRHVIGAAHGSGFEHMGAMTEPIAQIGLDALTTGY